MLDLDRFEESYSYSSIAVPGLDVLITELRASRKEIAELRKTAAGLAGELAVLKFPRTLDALAQENVATGAVPPDRTVNAISTEPEYAPDWKPGDDPMLWKHGYVEHISYPGICGVEINPVNGDRCGRYPNDPIHASSR